MSISAALVKQLRDMTGAGMMDCKAALAETNGDIEAAVDWLRAKGIAKADKKAGRTAAEGLIGVAADATSAVVVEVNSETDFVARNDAFQDWLTEVCTGDLTTLERERRLTEWTAAPAARYCHPREEHLLPLMVVAGAAGDDVGRVHWSGTMMGVRISAARFG